MVHTKLNAAVYDTLSQAMKAGLVASAIGLSRGGFAISLAKSAIAGKLGAVVDLSKLPGKAKRATEALFSESQGRILVTVRPDAVDAFQRMCKSIPSANIGQVTQDTIVSIQGDGQFVNLSVDQLESAYRSFFKDW